MYEYLEFYPIVMLQSMISYWHHTVVCPCPSVRLSVRLRCSKSYIVTLGVGVGIESCTILFLELHFLFTFSGTLAVVVGCMVQPQRKPNRRNFFVCNVRG